MIHIKGINMTSKKKILFSSLMLTTSVDKGTFFSCLHSSVSSFNSLERFIRVFSSAKVFARL